MSCIGIIKYAFLIILSLSNSIYVFFIFPTINDYIKLYNTNLNDDQSVIIYGLYVGVSINNNFSWLYQFMR